MNIKGNNKHEQENKNKRDNYILRETRIGLFVCVRETIRKGEQKGIVSRRDGYVAIERGGGGGGVQEGTKRRMTREKKMLKKEGASCKEIVGDKELYSKKMRLERDGERGK